MNQPLTEPERPFAQSLAHLWQHGYAMLHGVLDVEETESLATRLSAALEDRNESSVLRSRGRTYGSRNLLETFPEIIELLNDSSLREFAPAVLGQGAGIVRVLYFDKPPDRSWSLPWHKDRTIAVKRNDLPSEHFRKPTTKAGVPHVEAPRGLLEDMLTLRIHLDPMSEENGPLRVIPGSHREGNHEPQQLVEVHARVGDVLAMRPLLSHSSTMSRPETTLHRRVVHVELARDEVLPDGYEWHAFIPLGCRFKP